MTATFETISAKELSRLHQEGKRVELIDVRTPAEFQEVHVEHAQNVPLDRLDPQGIMECRDCECEEPLYVICRGGKRGQQACEKFLKAGYYNVVNVDGGTLACVEAQLPVVRGKKTISLERQVRIIAGLMIVAGVLLGWYVNPWLSAIAAGCGLGLLHAGVTDSCAMGLMLARMPWNQVRGDGATCSA
jgi:rhodanese-related sulfurtransferase